MKRLTTLSWGCVIAIALMAAKCDDKKGAPAEDTAQVVEQPPVETPAPVVVDNEPPKLLQPDPNPKNAQVRIKTPFGDMVVKLYDETPWHRDNFLQLVDKKYYDGTLFHRCIKGFMVQGGDPKSKGAAANTPLGMGGPGYTVPAEFNPNLIHKKGALAAARQGDMANPKRESSGSQFYIVQGSVMNDGQLAQMERYVSGKAPGFKYSDAQKELYKTVGGTAQLDMDYTVFGEILSGMNVIDSIAAQPTRPGDRPLNDIPMTMERIK